MEMTNENLKSFRKDFSEAMKSLEEKYQVTVSLGRITYDADVFSAKVTVTNGRDPEEVARSAFDSAVWKYEHLGLYPGMYNRVFIGTDGKKYAIRGFRTQAKKWPIEMLCISDGEIRVCNEQFIREFLDEYYTDVVVS